jgi:hypothetical protein
MKTKPPLPNELRKLNGPNAPLHVATKHVRKLVEHWGYTENGEDFVKKLVRCGVLKPVKLKHQRGNRFVTTKVLELYEQERA